MITVKVKFFGTTVKKFEEVLVQEEKVTVKELIESLCVKYGDEFRKEVDSYGILHLRNGAYTQDKEIKDADELTFIRPLSGG